LIEPYGKKTSSSKKSVAKQLSNSKNKHSRQYSENLVFGDTQLSTSLKELRDDMTFVK